MPGEGQGKALPCAHLTPADIHGICKEFVKLGIKKIRLTGGEPLLHRQIGTILNDLSQLPVELAITTNGIFLDKFPELMKGNSKIQANVSLDTLDRKKFFHITKGDYFDKVNENINRMLNNGLELKLNIVVIRNVNDDEIINFINYTEDKNVEVRFIEFMPFRNNGWNWANGVAFDELLHRTIRKYFGGRVLKLKDEASDTTEKYKIRDFAGRFAFISTVSKPFCEHCNRLRITADGKLKNCLFSQAETDLISPYRRGEDIVPLIIESVYSKKAVRGGMGVFSDFADPLRNQKNRSMVDIGG